MKTHEQLPIRRQRTVLLVLVAFLLLNGVAAAQGLTGTLIGTVKDDQGGVLTGAVVRLGSPALIGGVATMTTNARGQLLFHALPPGVYLLDITMEGFSTLHEPGIVIGAGATIERTVVLKLAGIAESVVVEGAGSRIDARNPGFGTRFGPEDIKAIPTRRASMFDWIRAAPGISPTSPSSGTATTVSAFGSGANENQFLIDGTNFTCPCNGVARAEPGVDFIQEVQIQSTGTSAEFGNVQGAVINVVTKQGSARLLYDASYYSQTAGLTGQPIRRPLGGPGTAQSGYERNRYRDLTTNLGGPVVRDRAWFFVGYLIGCGDQGSPTAPTAPSPSAVQQPSPQPTGIQPSITAIAPQVGSTRGGAWATITGIDFQPGAKVRLGDTTVSSSTRDSTTILVSGTAAHAAGTIDVIVTNPGGLEARLSGGYTYEQPESFDFNGDWVAHAGPEFETDMRFTIRNNVLVSVSCGTSAPLTFAPAPSVKNGEFSFLGDDGLAIAGTLVSPMTAVGTINVPACSAARWWADKSGVAAVSRYGYTGR